MRESRRTIESPQNPLLKKVRRLARARRREPSFLIEGRKLVEQSRDEGVALETILVSRGSRAALAFPDAVMLKKSLFASISTLDTPDGAMAIATRPESSIERLPAAGVVAVSAGIQDPGNLGALARVSEASGASALVLLPGSADAFSPKAVRGSMGSVLRLPVVELPSLSPLREHGFRVAALVPRDGSDYRAARLETPLAVVLGREGAGLDPETLGLEPSDLRLTIPMHGRVESLNVATAAAVVLFEATRRERP